MNEWLGRRHNTVTGSVVNIHPFTLTSIRHCQSELHFCETARLRLGHIRQRAKKHGPRTVKVIVHNTRVQRLAVDCM